MFEAKYYLTTLWVPENVFGKIENINLPNICQKKKEDLSTLLPV
jgi:hypothetical protein